MRVPAENLAFHPFLQKEIDLIEKMRVITAEIPGPIRISVN